jgi:ABC-2 type transport system permease protein
MAPFFQMLSLLNPLRHYITIVRGILLKGVGLDVLWIHVLALLSFAVVLLSISVIQREQGIGTGNRKNSCLSRT